MQHFFEQCVWNYFKLVLNYVKFYSDFLFFSKPPLWIVIFKHDCHKFNVKVFPFNISFVSLSTNLCKRVNLNNYCTRLEATHFNYIWNYLVWKFSWGGISWRICRLCYGYLELFGLDIFLRWYIIENLSSLLWMLGSERCCGWNCMV